MKPVIVHRKMHRKPRPGLPRGFDKPSYRGRNVIERGFGWLKELRRIATRYDKLARSFRAMVWLARIDRCQRADFSYRIRLSTLSLVSPRVSTPRDDCPILS